MIAPSHPPEWRAIAALSIAIFPIMLFLGFLSHPNLLDFSPTKTLDPWIDEWRGNPMFHIGHLLVMFAVPPVIASMLALYQLTRPEWRRLAFWSTVVAVFGAIMLAVDKGALTLTLTAFDSLDDDELKAARPALQAFLNREGLLWITWGYAALPPAAAVLVFAAMRSGALKPWQGRSGILGLLLLMNPDIELISAAGAALMCLCYIPAARRVWSEFQFTSSAASPRSRCG